MFQQVNGHGDAFLALGRHADMFFTGGAHEEFTMEQRKPGRASLLCI
jgi:hypothetical protein